MDKIYHHHIPRTSGQYIKRHLSGYLNTYNVPNYMISGKDSLDNKQILSSVFISGHVSNYPNTLVKNLITFCILRDPVERYISNFLYFSDKFEGITLDEFGLEKWMYDSDHSEKHFNIQAKSLTGTIDIDLWNSTDSDTKVVNNWFYKDYDLSETSIKDSIDSKICASLENRDLVISKIRKTFIDNYGFSAFHNNHKVNTNMTPAFNISEKTKNIIQDFHQADMIAYEYVKSIEHKLSV